MGDHVQPKPLPFEDSAGSLPESYPQNGADYAVSVPDNQFPSNGRHVKYSVVDL
eukprot:NODE_17952_length_186_cov_11.948905_g17038_i0.p2 GENE.NODE_17952_length_186_cov_11.948905_g17038_i0~~NODE_17952_length_186_cov_11.948905_g17038_i0.p2  ORF type:complete len:61 (-),score=10.52 NODE_17952_length_186_cov_11.948905_g17038_i0:3-164(-)